MLKTLAHRAGGQALISLRGLGNCSANLRWSYSTLSLLPRHPWVATAANRDRPEPKPRLSKLDLPLPPRIVRACDALRDFELVSATEERLNPAGKSLRLEQRISVEEHLVETMPDLVLVIKVELSWIQIGSSFASEEGPREYSLLTHSSARGYPLTLEEAVDKAIYDSMYGGANHRQDHEKIFHSMVRTCELVRAKNPVIVPSQVQYGRGGAIGTFWASLATPVVVDGVVRFHFPLGMGDREYLIPAGYNLRLEVDQVKSTKSRAVEIQVAGPRMTTVQENDFRDQEPPKVNVKTMRGQEVVSENLLGGAEESSAVTADRRGRVSYDICGGKSEPSEEGQIISISIEDGAEFIDRIYKVVSLKDYEEALELWRNQIIDRYKRQLIADVARNLQKYFGPDDSAPIAELTGKQKVAAYIGGCWFEGIYQEKSKEGDHIVAISAPAGWAVYAVTQVQPLEEALTNGLSVQPPFNPKHGVGTQFKLLEHRPFEATGENGETACDIGAHWAD
jgi:hypothetical protein